MVDLPDPLRSTLASFVTGFLLVLPFLANSYLSKAQKELTKRRRR